MKNDIKKNQDKGILKRCQNKKTHKTYQNVIRDI